MITTEQLADKIAAAFVERFGPAPGASAFCTEAATIAADVAHAAFALDPDAPQTVAITISTTVAREHVSQLLADSAAAVAKAALVTEPEVERAAEHAWDAHCEVHKSAKPWTDARESDRAMFRVVARAALETRQVPL